MRLSVRMLGLEVLTIEASTDDDQPNGPGDCTTTPIGFAPSPGDQRWEKGIES